MKQTIEDEANNWVASESVCGSYDEGVGGVGRSQSLGSSTTLWKISS